MLDRHAFRLEQPLAPDQIEFRTAERRFRLLSEFILQILGKCIADRIFPVIDKDSLRLFFQGVQPGAQAVAVRVAADPVDRRQFRLDRDLLGKELDGLGPVQKDPAEGPLGLEAHEQDRAFRPPEIVL